MEDVRGHNEGSIYRRERDGLTVVAVTWPDGSRRYRYLPKSLTGRALTKAANAALVQLVAERDAGLGRADSRLTLEGWLRMWLAEVGASPRFRPATQRYYAMVATQHIIPTLGGYSLRALGAGAIQTWLDGMTAAPRTVQHRRDVLRRALNVALRRRLVTYNAALGAELPKVPVKAPETLTAEQCAALIAGTRRDWYGPLWALLLGTGLRISEALGLAWDDVDGDTIRVTRQLANRDGQWVRVPLKASRLQEGIALPVFAAAALRRHRLRMATARTADWTHFGHVFVTAKGRPPQASRVALELAGACKRLGLPRMTPHALRHTSLTILRAAGIDEQTRMARAGHSTTSMARHYAHTVSAEDRAAADALQRVIGG